MIEDVSALSGLFRSWMRYNQSHFWINHIAYAVGHVLGWPLTGYMTPDPSALVPSNLESL
jgi:hypothetical protein